MTDIDNNTDVDNNVVEASTYMLTTVDNPYDPFTEWDEWYAWDRDAGYHTPGFLDRVARLSDELSEGDQYLALQDAMDEIVRENVMGVHVKVSRDGVKLLLDRKKK